MELRKHPIFLACGLSMLVTLAAGMLLAEAKAVRDWSRNWLISHAPERDSSNVVVIEIDNRSIADFGSWPWKRELTGRLIQRVSGGRPAAIAIDIVFPEHGKKNAGTEDTAVLAKSFTDSQVILGALLADNGVPPNFASPPVLYNGTGPSLSPWIASGGIWPALQLNSAAEGVGISSLGADATNAASTVNAITLVADLALPSLALETLRVSESATAYIYDAAERTISVGGLRLPVSKSAGFYLVPSSDEHRADRTISAADVLAHKTDPAAFIGKIVIIGGSAPETGGLRQTFARTLVSSAQIQADAIETILNGNVPYSAKHDLFTMYALTFVISFACALIAISYSPLVSGAATICILGFWLLTAILMFKITNLLLDPLHPVFTGAVSSLLAATVQSVYFRRSATSLRRSFEQHLSPAVVAQLSSRRTDAPLLRQRRLATVLFTDIEGFTAMTGGKGAEAVTAVLDDYFEGVTSVIHSYGGTVDKIVGDAVHALFNAVTDLEDHADLAVFCAKDIVSFEKHFRNRDDVIAIGLGRTRVGIESGELLVGEVGSGAKRDYTAHGDAINLAARLEALNNDTGTSICIGPFCKSLLTRNHLIDLGFFQLKGFGNMPVFSVGP